MDTKGWFYVLEGGKRKGPLDLPRLVVELCAFEEPGRILVWNDELPRWMPAGDIEELARRFPPPVPFDAPAPDRHMRSDQPGGVAPSPPGAPASRAGEDDPS